MNIFYRKGEQLDKFMFSIGFFYIYGDEFKFYKFKPEGNGRVRNFFS